MMRPAHDRTAQRMRSPATAPAYLVLLCVASCISSGEELERERQLVPTLSIGQVHNGRKPCAGTLVRADRVLTLARCVNETSPDAIYFATEDGTRRRVESIAWGEEGCAWSDESPDPNSAPLQWAMLSLDAPVSRTAGVQWTDASEVADTRVWLETFDASGHEVLLLACKRYGEELMGLDCTESSRLPGGLAFTLHNDTFLGVGIDRGPAEPMLGFVNITRFPGRIADVTLSIDPGFSLEKVSLLAADSDWKRISRSRLNWDTATNTVFVPRKIAAFFDDDEGETLVSVDAAGSMYWSHGDWLKLDVPALVSDVAVIDEGDETVLWLLGSRGELCRRPWRPTPRSWQCGPRLANATSVSVARVREQELLLVASDDELWLSRFQDSTFTEPEAWGDGQGPYTAVHLGQLRGGTEYALVATARGDVFTRLLDKTDIWGPWTPFSAGTLPHAVVALTGAHVAGWPETIVALAGGRVYSTREIVPPSAGSNPGSVDAGAFPTVSADATTSEQVAFQPWR